MSVKGRAGTKIVLPGWVLRNRSKDLGSSLPPNPQKNKGNGVGECLWRTLAEWKEHKVQGQ